MAAFAEFAASHAGPPPMYACIGIERLSVPEIPWPFAAISAECSRTLGHGPSPGASSEARSPSTNSCSRAPGRSHVAAM